MYESERLARAVFSATAHGELAKTLPLIHPDAVIVPGAETSTVVSRADLVEHLASQSKLPVLDSVAHTYTPLDDERIIVEGRVRVRLENGGFSDHAMVWGMVFRDGLLFRSWAVRSVGGLSRSSHP